MEKEIPCIDFVLRNSHLLVRKWHKKRMRGGFRGAATALRGLE